MHAFTTQSGAYHIVSHGNGWAYEVTDQATGDSLWFQDEDASRLQDETADFEHEGVLAEYFECLCE